MSAAPGDGPAGDDATVYPPRPVHELQPPRLAFREHPDNLGDFEVLRKQLAGGVLRGEAFQHVPVHLGLARLRELGGLPAVSFRQAFRNHVPAGRVELDDVLLDEGLPLHIAACPVVDLGDEGLLLHLGRKERLQFPLQLIPAARQFRIQGRRPPLVEGDARPLLPEDDLLKLMLQRQRLRAEFLREDALVELGKDLDILKAVVLHLLRPAFPCVLRGLAVVALVFPQPVAPRLKAVLASQPGRKGEGCLLLPAEAGEVHIHEVGPDEAGRQQGVEAPGQGNLRGQLVDDLHIKAQAVVGAQQRG